MEFVFFFLLFAVFGFLFFVLAIFFVAAHRQIARSHKDLAEKLGHLVTEIRDIRLKSSNTHDTQRCTWDEEHGIGIILHGDHALELGGADTVGLLWVAEGYAEKC